jgi:hypothetical protein
MHSPSKTERLWFSHLLESKFLFSSEDTPLLVINEEKKRRIHKLLARSEVLDNFLQLKFPNLKRVNTFPSPQLLFRRFLLIPPIYSTGLKEVNQCFQLWILSFPLLLRVCLTTHFEVCYNLINISNVIAGIQNIILGKASLCL